MTGYDLFAFVVIVFSAMSGWVRGGAREVISFFSFLLAAIVALIALPVTGPIGRAIVDPDWIGTVLAAIISFLAVYFGVRLFGTVLSRSLRNHNALSSLDRTVGLAFGTVRALVLLGVVHLIVLASTSNGQAPGWLANAALHPISAGAARAIQAVLPGIGRAADQVAPVVVDSARRGATDQPQSDATDPAVQPGSQP